MSEKAPQLPITFPDGSEIMLHYKNTTLYTFLGQTAIGDAMFENASANHAFVVTGGESDGEAKGVYFFERFHPVYQDIAAFAVKHSLPAVLNQRRVPDCDFAVYMKYARAAEEDFSAELEDITPEDFNP